MIKVKIKHSDDGTYVVPENLVEKFDELQGLIQTLKPETKGWYNACHIFESEFGQFDLEGQLSEVDFYLQEDEFNNWFVCFS